MNYGGEFDKKFDGTASGVAGAREMARKQGRRGTVNTIIERPKVTVKIGVDAPILEVASGESIPSMLSSRNVPSASGQEAAADSEDENEFDWRDDENCDERQELQ